MSGIQQNCSQAESIKHAANETGQKLPNDSRRILIIALNTSPTSIWSETSFRGKKLQECRKEWIWRIRSTTVLLGSRELVWLTKMFLDEKRVSWNRNLTQKLQKKPPTSWLTFPTEKERVKSKILYYMNVNIYIIFHTWKAKMFISGYLLKNIAGVFGHFPYQKIH